MAALAACDGHAMDDILAPEQGDHDHMLAEHGTRAFFYQMLEEKIASGGFFTNPDMRPVVMRNIKAMFNRFPLSEQDIRTLHGIMKSIERSGKAIDHADDSDQA
jgi:tRNA C32,U32 (ribose-2'-O)-methylase TrmJ